ncbi:MAG: 50S ribosomal protein L30 [Amoebophilaceae bacterium]|jgi:large subunit ribosomal protein L30|nr:50S ribosomal protein L30 [Amoebophilaceae bacterium]
MARVRITQIKSLIGYPHQQQKRTMSALGFGRHGRINRSVEHELTPAIQGMVNRISHLVVIEKL